ncbi:hypothetical protein PSHT_16033 [Puccinia striiformis]|uniref:Uncharacterized protein n=1 Tax=Puccinia striiformis TaxID=27350 RepID=A0A2S4UBT5_9BASI|nr:hypothetical protein PSHT_16033 [Puccinia striiformis]
MADLEESNGEELEPHGIENQAYMAIQGFTILIRKCCIIYIPIDRLRGRNEPLSTYAIEVANMKEAVLARLQETLPLLRIHLTTLAQLLDPSSLQQATEPTLQRV